VIDRGFNGLLGSKPVEPFVLESAEDMELPFLSFSALSVPSCKTILGLVFIREICEIRG
jgi:hypothetical protein